MKKILYSVALAACCMSTMTSCSDFLDAENKSNVSDKQTFATKDGFNTLVNDAYQHLHNIYAAPLFTSCFSAGTDMYADARNKMNEALNTYETLTPKMVILRISILISMQVSVLLILYLTMHRALR